MKKLSLIALILMASVAQADFWSNCTAYGGTIITANKYGDDKGGKCNDPNDTNLTNNCNGKKFCVGNNYMNFWSVFTWCESIGGEPATFNNLCPSSKQDWGYCPNLRATSNSSAIVAGNTPRNSDSLFFFNLKTGEIDYSGGHPRSGAAHYAICQEKS